MPVGLSKADVDKETQRFIQGVASTEDRDLQGEIVKQSGIDTSYFIKYGYINDDHKDGPEHKVGEPTECKHSAEGLWIKGFLYKGKDRSDYWWEHLQALESSGSSRKVGLSIQGKVLRRDGHVILKCWLQDVAITAAPVNTNTYAELMKSLSNQVWCAHPLEKACKGCGSCKSKCEEEEEKALSAGGMGRPLIPQSLEGSAKVQTFKSVDRISYPEAIHYLTKQRKYSVPVAKALADAIFATVSNQ